MFKTNNELEVHFDKDSCVCGMCHQKADEGCIPKKATIQINKPHMLAINFECPCLNCGYFNIFAFYAETTKQGIIKYTRLDYSQKKSNYVKPKPTIERLLLDMRRCR